MAAFHCSPSINNRESRGSLSSHPQTKTQIGRRGEKKYPPEWTHLIAQRNIQLFLHLSSILVYIESEGKKIEEIKSTCVDWPKLTRTGWSTILFIAIVAGTHAPSRLAFLFVNISRKIFSSVGRERTPNTILFHLSSPSFSFSLHFLSPRITSRSYDYFFLPKNFFAAAAPAEESTRVFYQLYTLQKSLG